MPAAQLFQSTGVEEQWHSVIEPWLRTQTERALADPRPTVILTPSRAESFYLRGRLVEKDLSFAGLRFWTPSDARQFLLASHPKAPIPATQPELRLTARMAAEKLLEAKMADEPSLKSVAREPGPFLNAYDLLLGADWQPAEEGAVYGRRLAAEFEKMLAGQKVATQSGVHRFLRQEMAASQRPLLAHLLVAGFNATHWPLWDLLRAVVAAAQASLVSLLAPRAFATETDQLWISSWEEVLDESVEITSGSDDGDREAAPFAEWVASYEKGETTHREKDDITFIATADLQNQIEAVVLQTLGWLRDKSCRRLGIVFPEANALSLGVAGRLRQLGVPLDDGTGHWQPGLFEQRPWRTWLALQEDTSVEKIIEWGRACEAEGVRSDEGEGTLTARELATALDAALGETLVDDLGFLLIHLEEHSDRGRAHDVAAFLRHRIQLPENGTFAEFFAATRRALTALGWNGRLTRLESVSTPWLHESRWTMSRRTFLEWLKEATDSRERTRGPESNHFYGKVHLLIYAQMPGQTWTHLILTGLNEGKWPRFFEAAAFGSRHELAALNRQARQLNRRGTTQGSQGEGHEVVRDDRGYCLLPLERQELALRDLCAAVEGTSVALCLAAMTKEAGRSLLPSDLFAHAWQSKTGRVLDDASFRALARRTEEESRKHRELLATFISEKKIAPQDPDTTRIAYAARRDPTQPFGRYEFAFAEPPPEPIQLACKKWEEAWNHPAAVWLEKVIGVAAWPEGQLGWPRAVGTWVHRWLTASLRRCADENAPENFSRFLRDAIDREPVRLRAIAGQAETELYPWWTHVWGQARAIALSIGEALAPELRERVLLSEYRLPSGLRTAPPGVDASDFALRGQIDLLLLEPGSAPFDRMNPDFTNCSCWIIDFKTGSAKNLNEKKLEKGVGLQAILYALAVRALGGEVIAVSLQTFDTPLKPQLQIEQVMSATPLFRSLDRFHRAGIFGLRPDAENEYGFAPAYPLATRSIASGILEAKWALVHGQIAADGESEE
jgi:hypothetical protein